MSKTILVVILIFSVGALYILQSDQEKTINLNLKPGNLEQVDFLSSPSAIGTEKNPRARADYETRMLVNPSTNLIPKDIKKRTQEFTSKIPTRSQFNKSEQARTRSIAEFSDWQLRGPVNVSGRTRALAIDVTNNSVILAGGVSGGMWRSENSGINWNKIEITGSTESVSCISQDTRSGKENIWYYGSGEIRGNTARLGPAPYRGDGIFKSVDGGKSWEQLESTSTDQLHQFDSPFNYVFNIVTDHTKEQDIVYAAVFGGIMRSADGGSTWKLVLGDSVSLSQENLNRADVSFYTEIAIDRNGALYATLSEFTNRNGTPSKVTGIHRSNDGINWTDLTPNIWPNKYRKTSIGISESDPNIVYFISDSEPETTLWRFVYNPVTKSGVWTNRSQNLPAFGGNLGDYNSQQSYNQFIAVHPNNKDIVFLGGTNLYRSTNGFNSPSGTSWIGGYAVENDNSNYENHHPDQHAIFFYPDNPNKALSAHDGGVSQSENITSDNVEWTALNNGFITSQFYAISLDHSQINDYILGGMQDNGSYLTLNNDFSKNWSRLLGGDGTYNAISRNAAFYYLSFQESRIFRFTFDSNFDLSSFARVDPFGAGLLSEQEYLFVNPFILDPNDNNIMYLAGGDKIWRNINVSQIPSGDNKSTSVNWDGLDFTRIEATEGQISALTVSTNPSNVLYFGTTAGKLFKIEDANVAQDSTNLTDLTSTLFPDGNPYISCIAVDPLNSDNLLVTFANYEVASLFYSRDGGMTFASVGGNLEQFPNGDGDGPSIRWATIIPLTDSNVAVLVGTSEGLYSTSELDGDNTLWIREGESTIGEAVIPMIQYRSLDGTVIVGTHGNGVYSSKIDNALNIPPNIGIGNLDIGDPYPNPFSDRVNIPVSFPSLGTARFKIYDPLGKEITRVFWGTQLSGKTTLSWDGKNSNGAHVPNGIYLAVIEFEGKLISQRVLLNR